MAPRVVLCPRRESNARIRLRTAATGSAGAGKWCGRTESNRAARSTAHDRVSWRTKRESNPLVPRLQLSAFPLGQSSVKERSELRESNPRLPFVGRRPSHWTKLGCGVTDRTRTGLALFHRQRARLFALGHRVSSKGAAERVARAASCCQLPNGSARFPLMPGRCPSLAPSVGSRARGAPLRVVPSDRVERSPLALQTSAQPPELRGHRRQAGTQAASSYSIFRERSSRPWWVNPPGVGPGPLGKKPSGSPTKLGIHCARPREGRRRRRVCARKTERAAEVSLGSPFCGTRDLVRVYPGLPPRSFLPNRGEKWPGSETAIWWRTTTVELTPVHAAVLPAGCIEQFNVEDMTRFTVKESKLKSKTILRAQ